MTGLSVLLQFFICLFTFTMFIKSLRDHFDQNSLFHLAFAFIWIMLSTIQGMIFVSAALMLK